MECLEARTLLAGDCFGDGASLVELINGSGASEAVVPSGGQQAYKFELLSGVGVEIAIDPPLSESALQLLFRSMNDDGLEPTYQTEDGSAILFEDLSEGCYQFVFANSSANDVEVRFQISVLTLITISDDNGGSYPGDGDGNLDGYQPRPDDADEIGDDATELDLSSGYAYITGEIDRSGDKDAFRFAVLESGSFYAGVWNSHGEAMELRLFRSDGTEIELPTDENANGILLEEIAAGTYFLLVSGDFAEGVYYSLDVSVYEKYDPEFPDVEPRDDDSDQLDDSATWLDVSEGFAWIDGTIENSSDVDAFRFEVAETSTWYISGYPYLIDGTGFLVRVVDGSGVELFAEDANGGTSAGGTELTLELETGAYYVVLSYSVEGSTGYALSISQLVRNGSDDDSVIGPTGDDGKSDNNDGLNDPSYEVGGSIQMVFFNASLPTDVNGDTKHTPLDVLLVINWLNQHGVTNVLSLSGMTGGQGESAAQRHYLDVNNDGIVSPLDALVGINVLNQRYTEKRVAEAESVRDNAVNVDWIFAKEDSELLTF